MAVGVSSGFPAPAKIFLRVLGVCRDELLVVSVNAGGWKCNDVLELVLQFQRDLNGIMKQSKSNQSEIIKQAIRDSGLRATPARIATLKLLHDATSPMTHAEVAEELNDLGVDKATVFRNLNDMATAGLLRRTELGDRVWRFELVAEGDHGSAHPHFVCVDCGTVSCMGEIKLTAGSTRLSQEFGEVTEILLRGHCNDCG